MSDKELRPVVAVSVVLVAALAGSAGCERPEPTGWSVDPTVMADGKLLFEQNCAACHLLFGQGAQQVPPLDGSPWVSGPPERLIRIVLHGLRGPIEIRGKTYDLEMPSFGTRFSNQQISAFLTYVRQQFGEPSPPITVQDIQDVRDVTQERERYWTVADLVEIP